MSDSGNILRAYGAQVVPRLPPGTDAHELGQALLQEMRSEPPVMMDLLRKYFQNPASEFSQTGYAPSCSIPNETGIRKNGRHDLLLRHIFTGSMT